MSLLSDAEFSRFESSGENVSERFALHYKMLASQHKSSTTFAP